MTRFTWFAAACGLVLAAVPADPQGPRGKGRPAGPAAAPRPAPHMSTPAFTRPAAPVGRPVVRPTGPSTGFVPSRPAVPQITRPSAPLPRPATRPFEPLPRPTTRPSAPLPRPATRPFEPLRRPSTGAPDIGRLPPRTTRPALTDPRLRGRPDLNRTNVFNQNVNRTNVFNRNVNRNVFVNRWGRTGRQVGAPRTWFSQPRNWGRTWWGGRPAWFWGRPWFWQHARWHHGFWNFWARPPAIWFGSGLLGAWYLGPGDTFAFFNPYWVAPAFVPTYLDYSVPLPIVPAEEETFALPPDPDELTDQTAVPPPAPAAGSVAEANQLLGSARESFRAGDYAKAQEQAEVAIRLNPSDPTLHEFRALTLFAQAKYQEAAAALFTVMTAGPGWDWPTVRDLYPDTNTYTAQLRALERFVGERPDAGYGHFLLAYHYLVTENRDAAIRELRETVRLQPDDKLSQALLTSLTSGDAATPAPAPGR